VDIDGVLMGKSIEEKTLKKRPPGRAELPMQADIGVNKNGKDKQKTIEMASKKTEGQHYEVFDV
jgi:hypothetical protein